MPYGYGQLPSDYLGAYGFSTDVLATPVLPMQALTAQPEMGGHAGTQQTFQRLAYQNAMRQQAEQQQQQRAQEIADQQRMFQQNFMQDQMRGGFGAQRFGMGQQAMVPAWQAEAQRGAAIGGGGQQYSMNTLAGILAAMGGQGMRSGAGGMGRF